MFGGHLILFSFGLMIWFRNKNVLIFPDEVMATLAITVWSMTAM